MPDVHADPDAMREFAAVLGRFSAVVSENMDQTRMAVAQLGSTWRDPGFDEFSAQFRRAYSRLSQFTSECDAVRPKLQDAAAVLEAYVRLRMGR